MGYKPLLGRPGGIYWYVLQTHSAAEVAFNRYWDLLRPTPQVMLGKPNESEKFVRLVGNRVVHFKSGDNFNGLRVETLDGAIIDEVREQHKELWPRIIRPMLARRQGWADLYSTSNGYEHFYDLCEAAKMDPAWGFFQAPSSEAWWWTPDELESARSTMSEDEFAQEIGAEFREFGVGKVYISHGSHNQSTVNPFAVRGMEWSPYLPIVVGLDFNVGMMCWSLMQFKGDKCHIGDEIAVKNTNSEECAKILADKVQHHKPGVLLIGDASGKSRKTSASGETDYSIILRELRGRQINARNATPEANPGVKDRVNIMNAAMKSANGTTRLTYNPSKCPRFKKDCERVVWKEGTGDAVFDKKDPELTHSSDGVGYPVCYFSNKWRKRPGTMGVIMR